MKPKTVVDMMGGEEVSTTFSSDLEGLYPEIARKRPLWLLLWLLSPASNINKMQGALQGPRTLPAIVDAQSNSSRIIGQRRLAVGT